MSAPAPTNPELVIRKVHPSITIFSAPFSRGGRIPFGGRSTVISLLDKSVLIVPSTALTPETLSTLNEVAAGGPGVKHLAVIDREHTMFVHQYADAFPEAKLYLPSSTKEEWAKAGSGKEGLIPRVAFTFGEGSQEDPFLVATGGEVQSADFGKAFANEDVALYHGPSKTVIEADLLFNLPSLTEQYSKSDKKTHFPFLTSILGPGTTGHKRFLWYLLGKDRAGMSAAAKKVSAWDFDRIIPCHGDVIETGAKAAWDSTYEWFINGKH